MNYDEIANRLSPKLKAISRKVRRKYTYCDEDDFYQEALLFLWMKFENGELDDKNDSYILQGCFYFLKNYIRKVCKSVDRGSVSMFAETGTEGRTIQDTLPDTTYPSGDDSVEICLLLDEAENRFTETEKDIFYYKLEGYTVREIGEMMGVSHVMVVRHGSRLRDKCRELMDRDL
ncbi:MAG: sigma-70 family RNA polymerase sigma factor [Candidatus Omnitrophica bacterium]|nr:sigma-70 family RNA polymerase sigma factor [Candidatus Omnitrophota bacterium]